MRTTLLILGILLGAGGLLLWQWMKPPADDPYFFLTPKPTVVGKNNYIIEKSVTPGKKGTITDFIFWNVPQPTTKYLYLIPSNSPSPQIMIRVNKKNKNSEARYDAIMLNREKTTANVLPLLNVSVIKVSADLSEKLIYNQKINSLPLSYIDKKGYYFYIKNLPYEYGQYKVTIESLNDDPVLDEFFNAWIHIGLYSAK
jgi:hypothetical protein